MRQGLSSVLAVVVLGLVTAAPVLAAKPEIEVEEVSFSFLDEFLTEECGFPVTFSGEGQVIHRTWTDENGDVTREVHTVNHTRSLTANGQTLTFKDSGVDKVTINPDGTVQVEIIGNLGVLTVPGYGTVSGAAGRVVLLLTPVLDEEGNPVLDEHGNPMMTEEVMHDSGFRAEEDIAAICAGLAA
jgi:hypothetical protein